MLDPSDYTVSAAIDLLSGLDPDELRAFREAEEEAKGRITLVRAISEELDARIEGDEEEEDDETEEETEDEDEDEPEDDSDDVEETDDVEEEEEEPEPEPEPAEATPEEPEPEPAPEPAPLTCAVNPARLPGRFNVRHPEAGFIGKVIEKSGGWTAKYPDSGAFLPGWWQEQGEAVDALVGEVVDAGNRTPPA